jgi:hypothetical protein
MVAETRLKNAETVSQIFVAWYSVCLIGLSLIDLSQSYRVRDASVITAILSVAVLATSIFLSTRNFSIRAAAFRNCYLKLQEIYWSEGNPEEKAKVYAKTLPMFENHLQRDHEWVLFQSFLHRKPLADTKGAVAVSGFVIAKCMAMAVLRWVTMVALFAFPLVLGYMLVLPR